MTTFATVSANSRPEQMQQTVSLFDNLIGAGKQRRGHFEAKRLRGLEVDRQLEPGRPLDGKIGGLGALEDAIRIKRRAPERFLQIRSVGHQPALRGYHARFVDR